MPGSGARASLAARGSVAGGLIGLLVLLAGCAATPLADRLAAGAGDHPGRHVELAEVPFHPQQRYQCGPAALATVLAHSGIEVTPEALVSEVYIPGRQGSLPTEVATAARRHGRIPYPLPPSLEALVAELEHGRPVLVFQNLGLEWLPQWHFAVAVGVDLEAFQLVLRSGTERRREVDMAVFERTWQRADHWAVIMLAPGELPAGGDPATYFQSLVAYQRGGGAGDLAAAYAAGTARWPQHPLLAMGHANLRYARDDRAGARRILEGLLEKAPDYAPAHNNLASLLLEEGRLRRAEHHARRAVALGGAHADTYARTLTEVLGHGAR